MSVAVVRRPAISASCFKCFHIGFCDSAASCVDNSVKLLGMWDFLSTVGYCERCGSPLCEGVRFCDRCGADQGEAIRRLREAVRSDEVRRSQYHEELGALRAEADTLTANNVQLKRDNEALELQKHAARTELLTLMREKWAREEAAAPPIGRRIKVALLIFAVVGVSLLAAVSLNASYPSTSDPTTSTETYFSVGTSTVTVTSQFSVTPQVSATGSELLMPVFGRWVTRNVTVQVNSNSSLESWILMRAIDTWNGAEGNFSRGIPAYELTEVTSEAQITVNFVSTLPAYLDGLTSCQQTKLPTGSWVDGIFTSCLIQVSKAIFTVSEEQLAYRLVLHELGHALGLGEVMGSTDIMDAAGWQQATGISTLDLYALQTLSTISVNVVAPSFIALSENAPYRVVPETL